MILINIVIAVFMMCVKAWLSTTNITETAKKALGVYSDWVDTYLTDICVLAISIVLVFHYYS